jgi:transmembrane sensor
MELKEYEIEDLLQDLSFCNYCRGNDEPSIRFWEEWIAINPEKQETCRQAKELYLLLNGNNTPAQFLRDRKQFVEKMERHISTKRIGLNFRKIGIYAATIAAMLVLVFGIRIWINNASSASGGEFKFDYVKTTGPGERKSFQLPDGSKVMLNAGSSLSLAKNFNISTREIQLVGEAFFDVSHNARKPFIIHTSLIDVKVLGTVFNVKAYPTDKVTETSLLRGLVMVTVRGKESKEIVLHPNEKIVLPNQLNDAPTDPSRPHAAGPSREEKKYKIAGLTYNSADSSSTEFSWTENRLIFSNDNFEEIAARLERWYNVTIRFSDEAPKQYRFTGTFDRKTIEQVLEALQLSRPFKFEIKEGNQFIIKNQ